MTLAEVIEQGRCGRELTPYLKWLLFKIEEEASDNYQIVEHDGTTTILGKN